MPHVEQDLAAEALMLLGLKQGHGYDPESSGSPGLGHA